ncbi:Decapping 5-like, putative isoform 1 [Hibiscus syriacus]|uniref:Decapping 5-like, putative isoform 1 n=1 Tax=Hibiscus syriacus TaxID=106335 RepID=A0A6A2ZPW5_HIBSY|nr:Decapping 5-like, putative isoform 1 [Hibiscus syriacus]
MNQKHGSGQQGVVENKRRGWRRESATTCSHASEREGVAKYGGGTWGSRARIPVIGISRTADQRMADLLEPAVSIDERPKGEYETADRMLSASDITGKLCDVAEAYSSDETDKAYAVTALMKIYAFEIAAGRKIDMLPECQSLVEELLASHSTDLQQRAYELNQYHFESSRGLRFEACELPVPAVQSTIPQALLPSTEIVPVPEPMFPRETYQTPILSNPYAGPTELKLRLDGKMVNGAAQVERASTVNSTRETYASRKPQVEISHEKQKLAASLFGGSSKPEKGAATGHKVSKASSHAVEKSHVPKSSNEIASENTTPAQPPPDLLDMGQPTDTSTAPSLDPFKQLEGLLNTTQVASVANGATAASRTPDVMASYADTPISIHNKDDADLLSGLSNPSMTNMPGATAKPQLTRNSGKGPDPKDSLEKDALVRQMGCESIESEPKLV